MNKKDIIYQEAVDKAACGLLEMSIDELHALHDYGVISSESNIPVAYWKYPKQSDKIHLHLLAERKLFYFPMFIRKYHSGIVIEHGEKRLLSDEELGEYD